MSMSNETMSLVECEHRAKNEGFRTATFDIVGPNRRIKAKWLDAYLGAFAVEGQIGVLYVREAWHALRDMGLHCENFKAGERFPHE